MRRFLLAFLFLAIGCGVGPVAGKGSLMITWQSNGNPGVPVCTTPLKNCWTGYTALDMTTEQTINLGTDVLSFTAPNATDSYEIRVNGYDLNGDPISSKYEVVPLAE